MKSSLPQFSYSLLLKLQRYSCFYCSKKLDPVSHCKEYPHGYTRDHFFPRSMGYTLDGNTVLACAKCNRRKEADLPTREEIFKFVEIWSHIRGGMSIDLEDFFYTQRLIDMLSKLVGPPVDRKNVI